MLNFCGKVRITWLLLSIEKGQAKLLWCEDKSVEEAIEAEKLGAYVKEGDLIKIESLPEGLQVEYLEEKTENIKEKARVIKEHLLKRNNEIIKKGRVSITADAAFDFANHYCSILSINILGIVISPPIVDS